MPEAQVVAGWVPPSGPLGELTRAAQERAAGARGMIAALERSAADAPTARGFVAALARGSALALIAEIKRRSPSKGVINDAIAAPQRARTYADAGARALSVLTESTRFGGSLADLREVRAAVDIPLLRKDFIVDRVQLLEARAAGADAVLLIARALPPATLAALAADAAALGLDMLVEVRSEEELARAIAVPGAAIGVNNRDLETLVIEPEVGARLIPRIPAGRVAVYESGVTTGAEGERAAALGADAVLVGSALSSAAEPADLVRALTAIPRTGRG